MSSSTKVNTIEFVLSSIGAGPAPQNGHFLTRYMHTKLNYDRTLSIYIDATNCSPTGCLRARNCMIRNDKIVNLVDSYITKGDYPAELFALLSLLEKNLSEFVDMVLCFKKETEDKKAHEAKVRLEKQEAIKKAFRIAVAAREESKKEAEDKKAKENEINNIIEEGDTNKLLDVVLCNRQEAEDKKAKENDIV